MEGVVKLIIRKKRIMNLSSLSSLPIGHKVRVGITITEDTLPRLKLLGFTVPVVIGETLLPAAIGPVTKKNAIGSYLLHKDQEKELHFRMIEWKYNEWRGRYDKTEVKKITDVPYLRYPRTLIPPNSIEFTVVEVNGVKKLVSPILEISRENEDLIVHTVNIFLEVFNECEILSLENDLYIIPNVIRKNWLILPRGKMPWEKRKPSLLKVINDANGNNKKVIISRLEVINSYMPDFTAIGEAGFGGYVVFGFTDNNLYVLESSAVNNATYVLRDEWEKLSQLTKAEILSNELHEARIVHNKNWYEEVQTLMVDYGVCKEEDTD